MIVNIVVPELGESISEVEVGIWSKKVGDRVEQDEPVLDVESEKASVEIPAPASGVLTAVHKQTGETAMVGEALGAIDTEATAAADKGDAGESAPAQEAPAAPAAEAAPDERTGEPRVMPAARRVLEEHHLSASDASPTGPGGRVLKEDALEAVRRAEDAGPDQPLAREPITVCSSEPGNRSEKAVRMTPLRRTIAARLVKAKQEAALLTTFNEIDMLAVKALRKELGDEFAARHGIKLGFMSFFVRAAVESLGEFPGINAELKGEEVVYRDYCDIGIAVGGGKGLVVPVLRNAEAMSFAEIERRVADLGARAKTGKLTMEELEGGTFTISNGGIYGSMLSTPIVNPPQSGILGLHAIKDRPAAVDGQVVIRPMMYVALTYDHRVVDGREAVTFLMGIKQRIENPARLLIGV